MFIKNLRIYSRTLFRDVFSKLLYITHLTHPSYTHKHYLTIVTFHRVLPQSYLESYPLKEIAVTPEELEWFLSFFLKHFQCGSLSETISLWNSEKEKIQYPLLAITFDDGQLDNFLYAKPILEAAGIHATFFVPVENINNNQLIWHDRFAYTILTLLNQDTTLAHQLLNQFNVTVEKTEKESAIKNIIEQAKLLSSEERLLLLKHIEDSIYDFPQPSWDGMMSWEQLQKLIDKGHEIGSHSMSHAILPLCNNTQLEYEIKTSRHYLQKHLNVPVHSFCYPNGNYDYRTLKMVQQAGYHQAVTTDWGPNNTNAFPLTLSRCDIQSKRNKKRTGKLSSSRLAWRLSTFHPKVKT